MPERDPGGPTVGEFLAQMRRVQEEVAAAFGLTAEEAGLSLRPLLTQPAEYLAEWMLVPDDPRPEGSVRFEAPCPDCGQPCEWVAYVYPPVPGWCACQAT